MWEMVKRVTMCGVRGYAMLDINWSRLVGSRKLYRAVAMIYELLFTWTQIKMKRNNNSRPRGTFNVSARCYRSDKPPSEWKFILIGRPLHYARRKRNRVKCARQWLIHLENTSFEINDFCAVYSIENRIQVPPGGLDDFRPFRVVK